MDESPVEDETPGGVHGYLTVLMSPSEHEGIVMQKLITWVLVIVAIVFMAATIFNPSSRFFITPEGWSNLWHVITGQQ